jgi:hypothetical protein
MSVDGRRFCWLKEHGYPIVKDDYCDVVIHRVCAVWGVLDYFDVDQYTHGYKHPCDRDHRRSFMLKFADGLWHSASFGGISGEPSASCQWDAVPGETGEIAHLNFQIKRHEYYLVQLREQLQQEEMKHSSLEQKCENAVKEHLRKETP